MIESDKWLVTSNKTVEVSGVWVSTAAMLWRGKQVSGREKRQGAGAVHDASRQTRDIGSYRRKSCFIALKSCLESCYFSKESCIIVLYRGKNKESFFPDVAQTFLPAGSGDVPVGSKSGIPGREYPLDCRLDCLGSPKIVVKQAPKSRDLLEMAKLKLGIIKDN